MKCSFTKLDPLPWGTLIGKVIIDGIELDIFSNYGRENIEDDLALWEGKIWNDLNGDILGYKHVCVSLVRRYLYFKTGRNFANIWNDGHAKDWYLNAAKMGLERIPNAKDLKTGDLVCFDGGHGFGHIGFVRSVEGDIIYITHQNVAQNENDLNHALSKKNMDFDSYIFQGGLRIPKCECL